MVLRKTNSTPHSWEDSWKECNHQYVPLWEAVLCFSTMLSVQHCSLLPVILPSAGKVVQQPVHQCPSMRHHSVVFFPAMQVFHTRGLTLSMEYHNMRTVVRDRGNSFFDLRPEVVHIPGRVHCEVDCNPCLSHLQGMHQAFQPHLQAQTTSIPFPYVCCIHARSILTGIRGSFLVDKKCSIVEKALLLRACTPRFIRQ